MNTKTVTITNVFREEKTSPRTGKPFTSLRIKTNEYGQKWLSGFGNKDNATWKEGDTVQLTVIEKGEYLNFEMPKNPNGTEKLPSVPTAEIKNILNLFVMPLLKEINGKVDDLTKTVKGTENVEPDFQDPTF